MTIAIEMITELRVVDANGDGSRLSDIVPLLERLIELGSIAGAAQALGLSYRHAWGLLRDVEAHLGAPLLVKVRGRGSVLSPLGEKLMFADRMRVERLTPHAQALAAELSDELNRLLLIAHGEVRIQASHGYAVAALVQALSDRSKRVDIKYRDSADALTSLARGECDLAGFHLPIGDFRPACASLYRSHLDDARHILVHLTRRKQGLFVPKGNPKGISRLADLARADVRFVNRQPGSGTRVLLDLTLRKIGIDPDRINGYALTELTHSAIAAFVASDMADVGFGVQPAATQFGLDFIAVVDEDYYFACERAKLDLAPLAKILEILCSDAFKERVDQLDGYDPASCGELVEVSVGLAGRRQRQR